MSRCLVQEICERAAISIAICSHTSPAISCAERIRADPELPEMTEDDDMVSCGPILNRILERHTSVA